MTMVMQDQGEDDDLGRQERNVGHDPEAVNIVEAREYGVEQRYHAGQHQPRMEGDVTLLNESERHHHRKVHVAHEIDEGQAVPEFLEKWSYRLAIDSGRHCVKDHKAPEQHQGRQHIGHLAKPAM